VFFTEEGHIINPVFIPRREPWSFYQCKKKVVLLPYLNLPTKPGESCLYGVRHKGPGNFYVGETCNARLLQRM